TENRISWVYVQSLEKGNATWAFSRRKCDGLCQCGCVKSDVVFRYIDKNFRTLQRNANDTVNMP
ncbi:hypothetical protein, partial [Pseudomonas fluorescens]|uniref:hypothetical protein n=1 Tax=Pseudomonas fluorescens TaxID=294 RepID=UPI001E5C53CF